MSVVRSHYHNVPEDCFDESRNSTLQRELKTNHIMKNNRKRRKTSAPVTIYAISGHGIGET